MGACMDYIRCRSCGDTYPPDQIYNAQFWPKTQSNLPFINVETCRECANAFTEGKLHADATIDHSKL